MTMELIQHLKDEQTLLEQMLTLSRQQQEALVKYDSDSLQSITTSLGIVLSNLHEKEDARYRIVGTALKVTEKVAKSLTLSQVADFLGIGTDEEFETTRLELKETVQRLQQFNKLNRLLARRGTKSVRDLAEVITSGDRTICNVTV